MSEIADFVFEINDQKIYFNIKLWLNFMTKFGIRKSGIVGHSKIRLYKLVIGNICPIDDFEKSLLRDGTLWKEVNKIYAILEAMCNLNVLPKTMFRVLKLPDIPFQIYEAKSSNLRYYLIKLEKIGKVIILGSKKSTQKSDIKYLIHLVKDIHSQGIIEVK